MKINIGDLVKCKSRFGVMTTVNDRQCLIPFKIAFVVWAHKDIREILFLRRGQPIIVKVTKQSLLPANK